MKTSPVGSPSSWPLARVTWPPAPHRLGRGRPRRRPSAPTPGDRRRPPPRRRRPPPPSATTDAGADHPRRRRSSRWAATEAAGRAASPTRYRGLGHGDAAASATSAPSVHDHDPRARADGVRRRPSRTPSATHRWNPSTGAVTLPAGCVKSTAPTAVDLDGLGPGAGCRGWRRPSDGGSAVTDYVIQRSPTARRDGRRSTTA